MLCRIGISEAIFEVVVAWVAHFSPLSLPSKLLQCPKNVRLVTEMVCPHRDILWHDIWMPRVRTEERLMGWDIPPSGKDKYTVNVKLLAGLKLSVYIFKFFEASREW